MKKYFTFLVIVSSFCSLSAQEFEISDEQLASLTMDQIVLFQKYLSEITANNFTFSEKTDKIRKATKLFSELATIQTGGLSGSRKEYKIEEYLRSVAFPPPGYDIEINFNRAPEITSVIKIGPNRFKVTGKIFQFYEKSKDGKKIYSDYTLKDAIVIIESAYFKGTGYTTKVYIENIYVDKVFKG